MTDANMGVLRPISAEVGAILEDMKKKAAAAQAEKPAKARKPKAAKEEKPAKAEKPAIVFVGVEDAASRIVKASEAARAARERRKTIGANGKDETRQATTALEAALAKTEKGAAKAAWRRLVTAKNKLADAREAAKAAGLSFEEKANEDKSAVGKAWRELAATKERIGDAKRKAAKRLAEAQTTLDELLEAAVAQRDQLSLPLG